MYRLPIQSAGILALLGLLVSGALAAAPARPIAPATAPDLNPDPDIVEVELFASEDYVDFGTGVATKVWTYNGGIPGPTIRGKVGDTLIVRFCNHLPKATTIHWHGMEVPANMDGSHIAQLPVESGECFRYEFKLLHASLFWYHPHIRTNVQVEKGLYGALLVEDPDENRDLGLPENEHILVLDDILLDPDGRVAEPFPTDPLANAATQLNGREGNVLLVNGAADRLAKIRRGRPHRLRIVNTANARFMRLSIPGHTLYRIGGDGGLIESALAVEPVGLVPDGGHDGHMTGMAAASADMHDEEMSMISDPDLSKGILLTPGERADVVFTPHGKGPLSLEWHDVARGRHSTFYKGDGSIGIGHAHDDGKRPPQVLMRFKLIANDSKDDYLPPDPLRVIEPIDITGAGILKSMYGHGAPDESGDVTFFVQMKPDGSGGMQPLPFDKVTPEDAYTVTIGENGIWEVHNMTGGMHNFHTHGFSFQLLETEFVDMDNPDNNYTEAAPYQEVKDTILLPARPGAGGRSRTIVRLAASFDDTGREDELELELEAFGKVPTATTSGGWLFHCHLLEHSARGMMSFFQTVYPD
jgi:FtsP/CotA-like multicopper oxidase with cupredoxin domain